MSWGSIITQFVFTVGSAIAERAGAALSARIKQEPEPEANPVDIAIATKSAVSADREGKIASERAKKFIAGETVTVKWSWQSKGWVGTVRTEEGGGYFVEDRSGFRWFARPSEMSRMPSTRRLGDYGPSGGE
jgi:hypothetical protein